MIMGTGFAPFLGGPLRLADFVGLDKLVQRMETLVMQGERRFEPCELMRAMARDGRKFYQSHLTLSPPQPNYEHTQPST
jgi:3-hydroxyacyl-CoA dehydrogenase